MHLKNIKGSYPFFFVIDDGGFDFAVKGDKNSKITLETYDTILKIAKKFNIKIPICFTMKYLDKKNISSVGTPLEYLDELTELFKKNKKYLEIGSHGLTHEYKTNHPGEFYCLDINKPVPEKIQREHIEKSAKIFDYLNLDFPELFVPAYNIWEKGITDKILSEYGVKYIIGQKKFGYKKHIYKYINSDYLEFLPRASLGLASKEYSLTGLYKNYGPFKWKIKEFVKMFIIPRNPFINLYSGKSLKQNRVHSYMTHIGNFMPLNYDFWVDMLNGVKQNQRLKLCKDNREAIKYFYNRI